MKPPPASPQILDRIRVVLISTSHPGNVGSAARAMKTMGFADLVLVTPKMPDVLSHPEAIALASDGADLLAGARIVATLEEALADRHFALAFTSRRRELSHPAQPLRDAARVLIDEVRTAESQRGALVFGSETYGMSNDEIDRCQMIAVIPTSPRYRSLNLSQAVQLAAYETMLAANAFSTATEPPRPVAGIEDVESFLRHLESAAIDSGFLDPEEPKRFMTRMRRLFARARLEPEEIAILRGLLATFSKRQSGKDSLPR
jgi:tRNA/rRNA methyltransferase